VGATQAVMMTGATQAVPLGGGVGGGAGPGGGPSNAEEARRRRVRGLVALLVTLLVVLAVIAIILVKVLSTTQHVNVPAVAGETVQAATQTLSGQNLSVGNTSEKTSSSTARGLVISTDPASGAKVDKNSKVNLVVSAGPVVTMVTVPPSLVGEQFTAVTQALTKVGLAYKTNYVSSNKPAGTVLTVDPASGNSVKSTTVIKLTVVSSQSAVNVPNVVGFSQTSAGSTIAGAGLTLGSQTSACSQSVATGNIASQSPAANTQQPAGTAINLVVSNGPCSATVPDVIQETQAAAMTAISNTPGLTPAFTPVDCSQSGGAVGTVQSENPSAGTVLSPPFPQTVTMTVCQQPAASTTTTTSGGGGGGGGLGDGTTTTTTTKP
jgi:beta-lactam-binding protein with PASTA domain